SRQRLRELDGVGDGVSRFERRHDALQAGQGLEAFERFLVGNRDELEAATVRVVGVLGADARIIEARGNRVRGGDLSVVALEQVRHAAVEHADPARAEAGAVLAAPATPPSRLYPDAADAPVAAARMVDPDGVGA